MFKAQYNRGGYKTAPASTPPLIPLSHVVDGVEPRLCAAAMKCRNVTAASLRKVLLKFLDAKTGYRHQSQVRTG